MTYTRTFDEIKKLEVIVGKTKVTVKTDYWDDRSAWYTIDKALWSLPHLIESIQWQLDSEQSYNEPIEEKQNGQSQS